jgi:hypothetical protein
MKRMMLSAGVIAAAILTGCGGGGGRWECEPLSPPYASSGGGDCVRVDDESVEGFWVGTAGDYEFRAVVLENDEVWAFYAEAGVVEGVVQGTVSSRADAFTGSGYDYNLPLLARTEVTMAGMIAEEGTFSGTVTLPSSTLEFTSTYDTSYESAPGDATGTWTVSAATSTGTVDTTVTVSSNGGLSATNADCSGTGTLTPRSSGRNVYNLSVSFTGASCQFEGQTLTGIAVVRDITGGQEMVAAALLPDRSEGFFAAGTR